MRADEMFKKLGYQKEEWFGKRITINGVQEVNYDKDKNYKRW